MKSTTPRCGRFHTQFAVAALAAALIVSICTHTPVRAETAPDDPSAGSTLWNETTQGIYTGLALSGSSLPAIDRGTPAIDIADDGGGLRLWLGYGFNPVFALELGLFGAGHDTSRPGVDAGFAGLELVAVYRWRPEHRMRPYVKAGLGGYGIVLDDGIGNTVVSGGGVPFGGGFEYFLGRHVSIGFDVTHRVIDYDKKTIEAGATTGSFTVDRSGAQTSSALTVGIYF